MPPVSIMPSRRTANIIVSVIASVYSAHAQQPTGWQQVCENAKAQPAPVPTAKGPLSAGQLAKCDETALYDGLGKQPNYAAALQCGWYQRAHPQPTNGNMFYGPGVLSMLYANGRGVERNYDLAIRFACENTWAAPAEMEGRIEHLVRLRTSPANSKPFDICDDITSGLSQGSCTSIQTRTRDAARDRKIAALVPKFPPAAQRAFPGLQAAEAAFESARTGGEIDLSGTARGAFMLLEQAILADQFLINLQRFGSGDIPAASASDLAKLEDSLNQTYQALLQAPAEKWQYGTIKPDGIRETQRSWQALADAWASFAKAAYPKLSAERIRAQLVRLRLHQLQSLKGN